MIDSPGFEIAVRESTCFSVVASPATQKRIEKIAINCFRTPLPSREGPGEGRRHTTISQRTDGLRAEEPTPNRHRSPIRNPIARRIGFGHAARLGSRCVNRRTFRSRRNRPTLAGSARTTAAARSALGIHGFGLGGFLVDAGKRGDDDIGSLAARADFPSAWRMLLITPNVEAGLSGAHERDAFARLPPMPRSQTDRLSGIALTELLPAVLEADFDRCGDSIFEFGSIVGNYFAPVQGGTYATVATCELVEHLRATRHPRRRTNFLGPNHLRPLPRCARSRNCQRRIELDRPLARLPLSRHRSPEQRR